MPKMTRVNANTAVLNSLKLPNPELIQVTRIFKFNINPKIKIIIPINIPRSNFNNLFNILINLSFSPK